MGACGVCQFTAGCDQDDQALWKHRYRATNFWCESPILLSFTGVWAWGVTNRMTTVRRERDQCSGQSFSPNTSDKATQRGHACRTAGQGADCRRRRASTTSSAVDLQRRLAKRDDLPCFGGGPLNRVDSVTAEDHPCGNRFVASTARFAKAAREATTASRTVTSEMMPSSLIIEGVTGMWTHASATIDAPM